MVLSTRRTMILLLAAGVGAGAYAQRSGPSENFERLWNAFVVACNELAAELNKTGVFDYQKAKKINLRWEAIQKCGEWPAEK